MARSFNGTSDYVSLGNPSILTGTKYSVAAWALANADTREIISWRRSVVSANPIKLQLDLASGSARFIVRDDAGNIANSTKASAYSAGSWVHFAGVRDGNNTLVYVNGVAGTGASATIGTITVDNLLVGAFNAGALGNFWSGNICEIGFWSDALTAADVAALADGVTPSKVRPQILVDSLRWIRDLQTDKRAVTPSATGTAVAAHPRIYL